MRPACALDAKSCRLEIFWPGQFGVGETWCGGGIDWLYAVKISARVVGRSFSLISLSPGVHEMLFAQA